MLTDNCFHQHPAKAHVAYLIRMIVFHAGPPEGTRHTETSPVFLCLYTLLLHTAEADKVTQLKINKLSGRWHKLVSVY